MTLADRRVLASILLTDFRQRDAVCTTRSLTVSAGIGRFAILTDIVLIIIASVMTVIIIGLLIDVQHTMRDLSWNQT